LARSRDGLCSNLRSAPWSPKCGGPWVDDKDESVDVVRWL
jgi:hypothetical protein